MRTIPSRETPRIDAASLKTEEFDMLRGVLWAVVKALEAGHTGQALSVARAGLYSAENLHGSADLEAEALRTQ